MATVAPPMFGVHHHAFIPTTSTNTNASVITAAQPQPQSVQQDVLNDQFTTLFCRALYDYEAQDASALSFRRNDIIEVLTQQPSGWWDGLLGDERGWFPSNYVIVISDEEAELAFSGSEMSNTEGPNDTIVDMSHAMMRGSQAENEEWLENEVDSRNGLVKLANATLDGPTQSSDFWMPQVTSDGQVRVCGVLFPVILIPSLQIYYVNTQTGQHSRDMPQEADDETSDTDLAGLTSQSSSRSGTSAGLGLGLNDVVEGSRSSQDMGTPAGFGVRRRSNTPEPWIRKLADDGMSYYYFNKLDGQVQWTRPEGTQARERSIPTKNLTPGNQDTSSRLRSGPQSRQPNDTARLSVYSDDSDIQPLDPGRSTRRQPDDRARSRRESPPKPVYDEKIVMELTSAERIAQSLQQALSPPLPEPVTDLSAIVRGAIRAVVENIQVNGLTRRPEEDQKMDELIYGVVLAVRNLLYVSASPTGQIPNNFIPRDARDTKTNVLSQSPLKPAQRKVTATLSRLVLSARAMQYDSGSSISDTLNRIEVDAEELERAVAAFVLEVQRSQHSLPEGPETKPPKRLRGVFMTANVGLGLVGAGAAGGWKGFGWVSLDDEDEAPRGTLGTEVVTELGSYLSQLEDRFISLGLAIRNSDDNSGERSL
jgi:son of sevenless-like protein